MLLGTPLRLLIPVNFSAYKRKFAALCHNRFFEDMEYQYNLLERLNLLTLHNRRRHFDVLFLINVLEPLNVAPLSSKWSAFVFLLGTFVTSTCSLALLATAFQLDVFQRQMQFVNLQIFYELLFEC
jgi:hypothetical protein